jgi:hypothetical protein
MDSTTKTDLHPSLAATAGHQQCSQCGAALSADQRYCVECGERSGDARLPVLDRLVRQPAPAAPAPAKRRTPHITGSTTVLAGIATLILAMGVGVLIGRSSNSSSSSKNAGVQVVTVAGGGGATGASGAAAATAAGAAAGASKPKKKSKSNSSSGVQGGGKLLKPPKAVVTVGSPGTGPGYQHGKFTGNFFGPGTSK